jgi:enamine deaminase RidA (YjgF/YER057c/UK114 family)
MLRDHPSGDYRYMPGISAFSCGSVAAPGHEIVHVTLAAPVPWRAGFARIERHLAEVGRPRPALCGIELRSPAPFTFDGFGKFNEGYRALLAEWGVLVGDDNPIPRTNVAPVIGAPPEPSLYAFSYTQPGSTPAPTFIVAGAGELRDRAQGPEGIVRHGDTSPNGMRDKARFVMATMQERLRTLGGDWTRVTAIDIYTAEPIHTLVLGEIMKAAGPAAIRGVHWYPSRPPIQGLDYEMDLRGVARELVIAS